MKKKLKEPQKKPTNGTDRMTPGNQFATAVHEIEVAVYSLDSVSELLYLAGTYGEETRDVNCSTLSFLLGRISRSIEGSLLCLQNAVNDSAKRMEAEGVNRG